MRGGAAEADGYPEAAGILHYFKKVTPPARVVRFLGIDIDTELMETRLPADKLEKLQCLVASFLRRKKSTKKEL